MKTKTENGNRNGSKYRYTYARGGRFFVKWPHGGIVRLRNSKLRDSYEQTAAAEARVKRQRTPENLEAYVAAFRQLSQSLQAVRS